MSLEWNIFGLISKCGPIEAARFYYVLGFFYNLDVLYLNSVHQHLARSARLGRSNVEVHTIQANASHLNSFDVRNGSAS